MDKKKFINKENIGYRFSQLVIFVAHIFLLGWILYTLSEGGIMPFKTLLFHFLGMSIYGALLIRISAWVYKKRYQKELELYAREQQLDK